MRYLFFILLCLPFLAGAQGVTYQGDPRAIIINKGGFAADSILNIPVRDTVQWMSRNGNITIRPQDGRFYVRRNNQWSQVITTGSGSSSGVSFIDTLTTIGTKYDLTKTVKYTDSIVKYATPTQLNAKENKSNRVLSLLGYTANDTTYPSTRAVTEFIQYGVDPFVFYAYDRVIDSIDVSGGTTKYIRLYRHNLPALVDSFQDNNTTYTSGFGLILAGNQFRVDTALIYTAHHVDSLMATTVYGGVYPIHVNAINHLISHYPSGVIPGTYTKSTVDVYGHVTAGSALDPGDIPDLAQDRIIGLPDTIAQHTAWIQTNKQAIADSSVSSVTITGNATKTVRITKQSGAWIEGTFTDNDNQTLSLSNDVLSISGGNNITLPYINNSLAAGSQSFTGTATNSVTLTTIPSGAVPVLVTMNTAILDPTDWTRTGSTINLSFTTSVTDILTIYFSNQ